MRAPGTRLGAAEGPSLEEARRAALIEATGQKVVRWTPRARVLDVSSSVCTFTGRTREQLLGSGLLLLMHPEDVEGLRRALESMASDPRVVELAFRLRRHDGAFCNLEARSVPVLDPAGRLVEVITAGVDGEHRRSAEVERREPPTVPDAPHERLAAILEALPVGVAIVEGANGRTLRTNPAFDALFAAPVADLDALAAALVTDPDSPVLRALRKPGASIAGKELRIAGSDPARWIRLSAVPLLDGSGAVVAGVFTAVDITARRRIEERLRESERMLRSCLESIPAHVWIDGGDGSNEYSNRRFLDYTGMSFEQACGWGWLDAVHPDDRQRAAEGWRRALQGSSAFEAEVRYLAADGSSRWFLTRAQPLLDESGAVRRWFGVNIDIDDRKRMETALAAGEARFRRLVELDLIGVCTFDLDGRILDGNREYLRIVGYDEADLAAGRIDWRRIIGPLDEQVENRVAEELAQSGVLRPTEVICVRPDGAERPVVISAALHGAGARTGTAFLYDISERKQIEAFQQRLIGVVGHDLRSPLAAMITTLDMMLRRSSLPENERRSLERLRNTAERMRRITRDLLDYTRARVGEKLSLSIGDADLHIICADAVAEARLLAPGREIGWSGAGSPSFRCDAQRIEQALSNLVANAVKYGSGPIAVRWRTTEREAIVEVESRGAPIDERKVPQLFDPFRQGSPGAGGAGSLGLGLFIVREIARAHGGEATLEPLPDGNLARIVLPRPPA